MLKEAVTAFLGVVPPTFVSDDWKKLRNEINVERLEKRRKKYTNEGNKGEKVKEYRDNISHHRVQNGSGAHPASYPTGTRGFFPGSKAAAAWSWPLTSI
jgi:hypothetical protein